MHDDYMSKRITQVTVVHFIWFPQFKCDGALARIESGKNLLPVLPTDLFSIFLADHVRYEYYRSDGLWLNGLFS